MGQTIAADPDFSGLGRKVRAPKSEALANGQESTKVGYGKCNREYTADGSQFERSGKGETVV